MPLVAVVLAAGKGTRMKSTLPKVLHRVGGRPMLGHVLNAVDKAGAKKKVVVAGFAGEQVASYVGKTAEVVYQEQQLGTAHALMQAEEDLRDISGHVLVVCGDTPLITSETLSKLVKAHMENGVAATVLTTRMTDPTGYGRIIRDEVGNVQRIVEQKDGSEKELAVKEINTGVYCLALDGLFSSLKEISPANAQGEYYLTDIIQLYNQKQKKVAACICDDFNEVMGINSRSQLAEAEKVLRHRVLNHWMGEGVTVIDPGSTYVDDTVKIGQDTVLYPGTILEGNTVIGTGAIIGPNTRIVDAQVADDCQVQYSVILKSSLGAGCTIGPFAYIRPDSQLGLQVKVGDFVEVKKSVVGNNSKIPHLSYIGDSIIGRGVNVGAGTITCNYDGKDKHVTKIEDHVFVGSNANLVAPVVIGDHAVIAAGSTITEDVPAESLALARERQINKKDWAKKNSKY